MKEYVQLAAENPYICAAAAVTVYLLVEKLGEVIVDVIAAAKRRTE